MESKPESNSCKLQMVLSSPQSFIKWELKRQALFRGQNTIITNPALVSYEVFIQLCKVWINWLTRHYTERERE